MTKKRLNISGKIELVKEMKLEKLVKHLEGLNSIENLYVEEKSTRNKFKLGHEEKKISFNMTVNSECIGVSSTIHLGFDKSEILAVETFSGVNHFIDLEEYEKVLKDLLKDFTGKDVLFEFSISGISSNM